MSQDIERQGQADWRSSSTWAGLSTLVEPSRTPHPQPDRLAAASEWLRAAPHRLVALTGEQLIDTVAQIEDAYARFPELEIDMPRRALADEMRSFAAGIGGPAALPLLMACAVLDPSASIAPLLDRMVRAGCGEATARAAAILARRRAIAGDEISHAVGELCRQGCLPAALALTAEASGDGEIPAVAELGAGLKRLLFADIDTGIDPSRLARFIVSARNRLHTATPPSAKGSPRPQRLAPHLVAERVAAKLPRRSSTSTPAPTTMTFWRTGRLGSAEFAAQWPEVCGVATEWLPAMRVGSAGERRPAGVSAKPGQAGHLVYGPYIKLGAGDYRLRVRWNAGRPTRHVPRGQPVAAIEAVSRYGKTYLAQRQLCADECFSTEHEVIFHVIGRPPPAFPVEVRVWTSGAVALTVSSITVERIAAP